MPESAVKVDSWVPVASSPRTRAYFPGLEPVASSAYVGAYLPGFTTLQDVVDEVVLGIGVGLITLGIAHGCRCNWCSRCRASGRIR